LTRAEFERRYEAMPHLKRAELIEGVVYMPSPVRHPQHGRPHIVLSAWLAQYEHHTPGVECSSGPTVRMDDANAPEPDVLLFTRPECGGRSRVDADGYIEGAPELAAQVSASTVALDLGPRLEAYRRNGVEEYLVCRVLDQEADWFALRGDRYEQLPLTGGVLRSEAFPGLWLDPAALARGDLNAVLEVLRQGLASPEHASFVAELARRRASRSPT
jgi:Uma2 family endonuclease